MSNRDHTELVRDDAKRCVEALKENNQWWECLFTILDTGKYARIGIYSTDIPFTNNSRSLKQPDMDDMLNYLIA